MESSVRAILSGPTVGSTCPGFMPCAYSGEVRPRANAIEKIVGNERVLEHLRIEKTVNRYVLDENVTKLAAHDASAD